MTVLGANGFLGKRIASAAAHRGWRVFAVDRFRQGLPVQKTDALVPVVVDTSNPSSAIHVFPESDWVIDCLPESNPLDAQRVGPSEVSNLVKKKSEIFRLVAGESDAKYVYLSSGGTVYGESPPEGSRETDALDPQSVYGTIKCRLENELANLSESALLDSVILRISTVFGPRSKNTTSQGFVHNALLAAGEGRPIKVFGDGAMVRDYIYVDDVADVLLDILESPRKHRIYNVGSGHGTSISKMVGTLKTVLPHLATEYGGPAPEGFVQRSILNIDRLQKALGPLSLRNVREGLDAHLAEIRIAKNRRT